MFFSVIRLNLATYASDITLTTYSLDMNRTEPIAYYSDSTYCLQFLSMISIFIFTYNQIAFSK